jgi:hypothetical protein
MSFGVWGPSNELFDSMMVDEHSEHLAINGHDQAGRYESIMAEMSQTHAISWQLAGLPILVH